MQERHIERNVSLLHLNVVCKMCKMQNVNAGRLNEDSTRITQKMRVLQKKTQTVGK